jgi:hypothetical protein
VQKEPCAKALGAISKTASKDNEADISDLSTDLPFARPLAVAKPSAEGDGKQLRDTSEASCTLVHVPYSPQSRPPLLRYSSYSMVHLGVTRSEDVWGYSV